LLRNIFREVHTIFLGRKYTEPVVSLSEHIDEFVDWDELWQKSQEELLREFGNLKADIILHVFPNRRIAKVSKQANIPMRIGTSHRWSHFLYCNRLINFGRKRSYLHESQLNIKLLKPLINKTEFSLAEIEGFYGFNKVKELPDKHKQLLQEDKFNLILHPKSKGSAREWGEDNFTKLINILPKDKYSIFITGTKDEGVLLKNFLSKNKDKVTDLTGKLSLTELISFINVADGLVAASTGPLHIAASLNKIAVGIYAPIRPMHPGRWAPVGKSASYLVLDKKCDDCRRTLDCRCIREIEALEVFKKLESYRKSK
jgi:heptosyltransferase-3